MLVAAACEADSLAAAAVGVAVVAAGEGMRLEHNLAIGSRTLVADKRLAVVEHRTARLDRIAVAAAAAVGNTVAAAVAGDIVRIVAQAAWAAAT